MPTFSPDWLRQHLSKMEKNSIREPDTIGGVEAVTEEDQLHYDILDECKRRGWPAIHSRMDKPTGQTPGVPDFIIPTNLPEPDRRTLYIECKAKGKKQSTAQKGFQMVLEMNGHPYHLIFSYQEFLEIIKPTTKETPQAHD